MMVKWQQIKRIFKSHRFHRLCSGLSPFELGRIARDWLVETPLIVVVGSAHKVGSTWLDHMIEDLIQPRYDFEGMLTPAQFRKLGNSVDFSSEAAAQFIRSRHGTWQFKTHHDIAPLAIPSVKAISVHRDPRDMCVSTVHFQTNLPAECGGYTDDVKKLSFDERLSYELNRTYNLERAEYWWRLKDAYRVKYEDIKSNPEGVLRGVAEFLGIDARTKQVQRIIARHDFNRKSGRKAGEADNNSFLRKGIVGDWKNAFSPSNLALFKSALGGRWNQLLVEMGYEESLDSTWGLPRAPIASSRAPVTPTSNGSVPSPRASELIEDLRPAGKQVGRQANWTADRGRFKDVDRQQSVVRNSAEVK